MPTYSTWRGGGEVSALTKLKSDSRCNIQEQTSALEQCNQIQDHSRIFYSSLRGDASIRFYSWKLSGTEKG